MSEWATWGHHFQKRKNGSRRPCLLGVWQGCFSNAGILGTGYGSDGASALSKLVRWGFRVSCEKRLVNTQQRKMRAGWTWSVNIAVRAEIPGPPPFWFIHTLSHDGLGLDKVGWNTQPLLSARCIRPRSSGGWAGAGRSVPELWSLHTESEQWRPLVSRLRVCVGSLVLTHNQILSYSEHTLMLGIFVVNKMFISINQWI